jgi:hypothetical protein
LKHIIGRGKWRKQMLLYSSLGSSQKVAWRLNDLRREFKSWKHILSKRIVDCPAGGKVFYLEKPSYLIDYPTNYSCLASMVTELEQWIYAKPMRAFEVF